MYVNAKAELVTLAPGLRPERRFAPLARGQAVANSHNLRIHITESAPNFSESTIVTMPISQTISTETKPCVKRQE